MSGHGAADWGTRHKAVRCGAAHFAQASRHRLHSTPRPRSLPTSHTPPSLLRSVMPLQLSEGFERGDSTFSRLTMANIAPRSNIMWAHWVCCLLFLAWTLMLLEW